MKPQPDHSNDNDGYDPMQPNAAALLSQVYGSGNNNTHLNSNYEHRENGYNSYNANSSINNKGFNNFKKKPFKLSQKQLELRAKDVRPYVRNDNSTFDKWRHPVVSTKQSVVTETDAITCISMTNDVFNFFM